MSEFWNPCTHAQTSGPDEMGEAICASCGNRVRTTLTLPNLLETFDLMRRDHGRYGRHSRRCVDSDLGWVCADDCTLS